MQHLRNTFSFEGLSEAIFFSCDCESAISSFAIDLAGLSQMGSLTCFGYLHAEMGKEVTFAIAPTPQKQGQNLGCQCLLSARRDCLTPFRCCDWSPWLFACASGSLAFKFLGSKQCLANEGLAGKVPIEARRPLCGDFFSVSLGEGVG